MLNQSKMSMSIIEIKSMLQLTSQCIFNNIDKLHMLHWWVVLSIYLVNQQLPIN